MAKQDWLDATDRLYTAVVLDALDKQGLTAQSPRLTLPPRTTDQVVVGFAKTLLWMDFAFADASTYAEELAAVDSIAAGDLVICATASSARSGIWGELLTTGAMRSGAVGIITDGAVRDLSQITRMGFPVFSQYVSPYDSLNRQKVVAFDVPVEIGGVTIEPGDIIVSDVDGVAVVPANVADSVLAASLEKIEGEDGFRDAVNNGMSLTDAFKKFKLL